MKAFYYVIIIVSFIFAFCSEDSAPPNGDTGSGDVTIRDISIPKDASLDASKDVETQDIWDVVDILDTGVDVVSDEGVVDTLEDASDVNPTDTSEDISDVQIADTSEDIAPDVCIPDCTDKECGDDSCGNSCGSCGTNSICDNNKCICNDGFGDCNNNKGDGCEESLSNNNSHCGECNNLCGNNMECKNSQCECIEPFADCNGDRLDGCEINKNTDDKNCGDCNQLCSPPYAQESVCFNGSCKIISCKTNYDDCDHLVSNGCEADLTSNKDHCGSCNNSCGSNAVCSSSQCYCTGQYQNCNGLWGDGCESNKNTDPQNCGSCGSSCGINSVCVNKFCGCESGFANCDGTTGCEIDLNSVYTCGTSCSNITNCSSNNGTNRTCVSGICKLTCNSGYVDCNAQVGQSDGCEKQTYSGYVADFQVGGQQNDTIEQIAPFSAYWYAVGNFYSSNIQLGSQISLTNKGSADFFIIRGQINSNAIENAKAFGGSSIDNVRGIDMDSSSKIYITGYFTSPTLNLGNGNLSNSGQSDIFLAKVDHVTLQPVWSKSFGGNLSDLPNVIAVDSENNVYIAGSFYSDKINFGGSDLVRKDSMYSEAFIAKFDTNGNHLWSKSFVGDRYDSINAIFIDSNNNVYIGCNSNSSSISFGGNYYTNPIQGKYEAYVVKFDKDGNLKLTIRVGTSDDDNIVSAIAVDSGGNIIAGGYFMSSINFGIKTLTSQGKEDSYLVKFYSTGNINWVTGFGGTDTDKLTSLSIDSSSNIFVTGSYKSTSITLVGTMGRIYILNNSGDTDAFFIKYDSEGIVSMARSFGGTGSDAGNTVVFHSSNKILVGGTFWNTVEFGGCPLTSNGGSDGFITTYTP
jgi:hypothetical protein